MQKKCFFAEFRGVTCTSRGCIGVCEGYNSSGCPMALTWDCTRALFLKCAPPVIDTKPCCHRQTISSPYCSTTLFAKRPEYAAIFNASTSYRLLSSTRILTAASSTIEFSPPPIDDDLHVSPPSTLPGKHHVKSMLSSTH